jgi:glucose-6-phosphate 1-epimerase
MIGGFLYVIPVLFYPWTMASKLAELQQRFSIPGVVRFEAGSGDLVRAVVMSAKSEAEIYLHGAHVTRYAGHGQKPVLWMSGSSLFQADKPIRGGVPICFPWFGPKAGDGTSPVHGFARILEWDVESATKEPDGAASLVLSLQASDQTRKWWSNEFKALYQVRVGDSLQLGLTVENRGGEPMSVEEALHSYFTVGDIRQCSISGLQGGQYIEKTDGLKLKEQGNKPVTISAETDRVYTKTIATCTIHDPVLERRIIVEKQHSNSTVVWNPWIAKSKAMADFGDEEWPGMLCVETCNVGDQRITIAPQATHTMQATIRAEAGM